MIALLIALAPVHPAIEAERAFAAAAQHKGQWSAFRAFAAESAIMFDPGPVNAQGWLKDRKDPPLSVHWWPSASYVSCDGKVAVNTGAWLGATGKSQGFFTTVWAEQRDGGWKWLLDAGGQLQKPLAVADPVKTRRASCRGAPEPSQGQALSVGKGQWGAGLSPDRSLIWKYEMDGAGTRLVRVWLWNGRRYAPVIDDRVAVQ